ncbi:MAG TPA: bifunctional riboflavin kinase/FAD synthetase [Aggregatilineales bacterium]|nr:bifunctional riboflavin kinase/FAD synthetase [Anaerolineales bacterium]HRE49455.1 bifunctional riboflavin kinase/FAD synthetase [Aggregatilineales bacterium]
MQHYTHLNDVQLNQESLVTIGVFDGVHRGHAALIGQLVAAAKRLNRLAVVLTLFPHPDIVLRNEKGRYYLTAPEEKARLFGELGVDVVITHPFDQSVRAVRAANFVDLLRDHLLMSGLWVTAEFALGYQREGNFTFLKNQGALKGFAVQELTMLLDAEQRRISSQGIREALIAGDVQRAGEWLGRPYRLQGEVIHGDHRGRTIGFPTANLAVWEEQVIPANGVYACYAQIDSEAERYQAVTNIGVRPTFGAADGVRIEAHLLDFDRDIYGRHVILELVERLRGEQKFPNLEGLIAQISADAAEGRRILKEG